jgi:phosphopantothenoylcysteine decarboxylase / phosphopantothenate---cysteine ligase
MIAGKRILLIITGGIAAYKLPELIRMIARAGGSTRCVLTKAAREFVTPLTLASVSGNKVHEDLFSPTEEMEMGHIALSRSADLVVVAPATADIMAKAAHGLANDLASTLLLATDKPVLMAPAMNVRMWHHAATQRNLATLKGDGVMFVGPEEGAMACGEYGIGRLAEPEVIFRAIDAALGGGETTPPLTARPLVGKHVLITAGPTHEPIDPVRYIANRSSGKQGYALAVAARDAGARVTLISGPVSLAPPDAVNVIRVETAREMAVAVEAALPADLAFFTAAVADWRVEHEAGEKIKKTGDAPPALMLSENPDILHAVSHHATKRPALVVGFAAETEHVITHAQAKLARKGCDLIIANDVSPETGVMGGEANAVHLVSAAGVQSWPSMPKARVAQALIQHCAGLMT